MTKSSIDVLGGITAEQFLSEYWQKKPLLVRNAMPEVIDLFEPNEIKELALEEHISARLIQQLGEQYDQWQVKNSPFKNKDFKNLPPYWTLLVQALDQVSFDVADLWKKFHFLPQWRRDDVMISYAPKGGSVGKHFDFYDVFLVQAYGQRNWQLGQMCDANTQFVPNQPLKLLPEMQVNFNEILNPGDLLYVPPGLSHYGVAENDCLTLSFGFRMPSLAHMMDRTSDQFADHAYLKNPVQDIQRHQAQAVGEITSDEFEFLKTQLIKKLQESDYFDRAVIALMSETKYPDCIPEPDEIEPNELQEYCEKGYFIAIEPASRLLYRQTTGGLEFWANGELLCLYEESHQLFKMLADGQSVQLLAAQIYKNNVFEDVLMAINQAIFTLIDPDNTNFDEDDGI